MPGPAFLPGETVELRTIEEEDLDFLQQTINDPEVRVRAGLVPVTPKNQRQEQEWFESLSEHDGVNLLISVDGDPVGTINLKPPNNIWGVAEVGYLIAPQFWGEGYATEAVELFCRYAFEERRLNTLYATTFESNIPSCRVLEKNGFQQEGVLREDGFANGEHVDFIRYGLLAREWRSE